MSDEAIKVPCVQKTIALIYETFKGVTREGGTSWSETYVIDDYGTFAQRRAARLSDQEAGWEELVDDPHWMPILGRGGFPFLDAIGYRYYLPAAMIKALRQQGAEIEYTLLGPTDDPPLESREQWSALTSNEIQCVCEFLKCMDEVALKEIAPDGTPENDPPTVWREAYLSYWVSVDKDPIPLLPVEPPLDAEQAAPCETTNEAVSDEAANIPCVEETIALIYETFKGVTREGGVSWSEAEVIDASGTVEEQQVARISDQESSWEELVNDPNWNQTPGVGGFTFLDPIGFRYYLPAAMIKELRQESGSGYFSLELSTLIFSTREFQQWSALTSDEIQCVCEFLKCMDTMQLMQDHKNGIPRYNGPTDWRRTYLSYWIGLDADPMP